MFLPLVNYEKNNYCGGPTGVLAERWEHSPDYREWTIRLRDDIRWHDGVTVTAHDIAFTVELFKHPDVRNYNAGPIDSVEVLDEQTVRLVLSKPDRWPLEGWVTFYPKHLLEHLDPKQFYDWEFWTQPVGNGPYRYVRHVPATMMELEANPDYYRGRPRIERVVLRFVAAQSGSGLLEMRSGEADLTPMLGIEHARALVRDPQFELYARISASHKRWLVYNPDDPLFRDRRVRRALTQAMDRKELHRVLGFPEEMPVTDAPYSPCQFDSGEMIEPWPYDPAQAKRLLSDAGWHDSDGDGVLDRAGREFRFTLLLPGDENRVAVVIQDQLRRVGIRMELAMMDGTVVMERMRSGRFAAGIWPGIGMQGLFSGTEIFPRVYPRIMERMQAVRGQPDLDEQHRQYREMAPLFREELPATFLYPRFQVLVAHRRIHGFDHDGWRPPGWRWVFGGLEWLWIEEQ
jgi:peptide/nickel transport system substrate-binding protein